MVKNEFWEAYNKLPDVKKIFIERVSVTMCKGESTLRRKIASGDFNKLEEGIFVIELKKLNKQLKQLEDAKTN
jgi:phage-related minor tail protein